MKFTEIRNELQKRFKFSKKHDGEYPLRFEGDFT